MPHADLKIRRGIEPHRILPRQETARDCPHALDGAATNVQPLVEYWGVLYIDLIFHEGKVAETYNIGGFNEWKNIDIIKTVIKTVDRLLGRAEGEDLNLITYVADRLGHDARYAIDSTKLQKELGWEPSLQFEEGIEKTVKWYLDNEEWLENVTSGDYQKYYEKMYEER